MISIAILISLAFGDEALFAGGCFWCMEHPFDELNGVEQTIVGYAGGSQEGANYKMVSSGKTKHVEAIKVIFDAKKISYEKLLEVFWRNIDPTDLDGQFVDRGPQYQPVVFYYTDEQKIIAEKSKKELNERKVFDKPIVVPIRPFTTFFAAEDYHQDYYKKEKTNYQFYRFNSGRDEFIEKYWKN